MYRKLFFHANKCVCLYNARKANSGFRKVKKEWNSYFDRYKENKLIGSVSHFWTSLWWLVGVNWRILGWENKETQLTIEPTETVLQVSIGPNKDSGSKMIRGALGLYYFLSLRNGRVEIRLMSVEDVLLDALYVLLWSNYDVSWTGESGKYPVVGPNQAYHSLPPELLCVGRKALLPHAGMAERRQPEARAPYLLHRVTSRKFL